MTVLDDAIQRRANDGEPLTDAEREAIRRVYGWSDHMIDRYVDLYAGILRACIMSNNALAALMKEWEERAERISAELTNRVERRRAAQGRGKRPYSPADTRIVRR